MSEEYAPSQRDWLHDKFVSSLLWGLPPLVMAVTAFIDLGSTLRAVAWVGSLLVMSGFRWRRSVERARDQQRSAQRDRLPLGGKRRGSAQLL